MIIDETEDPKKGKKTDYVARQYIGRLGKVKNGIVSVVAYGLIEGITFPILFEVFKPQKCLKPGDVYKTKPQVDFLTFNFSACFSVIVKGPIQLFTVRERPLSVPVAVLIKKNQYWVRLPLSIVV